MAYFKIVFWNSCGATEQVHKNVLPDSHSSAGIETAYIPVYESLIELMTVICLQSAKYVSVW